MSQLSSAGRLAATLLLLAAVATVAAVSVSPSQTGVPACQNDIDALWSCHQYVQKDRAKVPPSPDCCAAVKALAGEDVPCGCGYLGSPAAREKISLGKVFYVTNKCGVTIPGSCGGSKQV